MVWLSICETNIHVNLTSDFMEGYLDNVRLNTQIYSQYHNAVFPCSFEPYRNLSNPIEQGLTSVRWFIKIYVSWSE